MPRTAVHTRHLLLAALALLLLAAAAAAELPPPPTTYFTDGVGVVSREEAAALADELEAFHQRTGIQFVIAVLPELDGEIADYTNRLFEHWKIGSRERLDGLLFAVFPQQRASRLEVAYENEERLTDAVSRSIIQEMQQIPSDQAFRRFALVMVRVAQRLAPDDPLAQGQFGQTPREARSEE
ncbi:hypothetical protein HGA89_05960, partial [bacterium]|nr:hypothetical protein [bacterium]